MAGFNASFNFQPAGSTTPAGYIADTGKSFTWQNGQQHGWTSDNTNNTVNRWTAADDRYDTFAYLGGRGAAMWEVAVPNGMYDVKVTAGDAAAVDAHYAIATEGTTVVNQTATWANRWAEGSARVWVGDGKLTVASAVGAWNNKINSVSITSADSAPAVAAPAGVSAPAAPSWAAAATMSSSSILVGWGDAAWNESGYVVQRSTDGNYFAEVARLGANTTQWTNTGLTGGTKYYYRIQAFNAGGTVNSKVASATTTGGWVAPSTPVTNTPAPSTGGPAAPSWTAAASMSSSSILVGWGDASWNESGFIIQKSTDGWTFGEAGRVGANATQFTATGLNAGTKYFFRVQPYNGSGTTNGSVVNATTSGAVWTPAPVTPTAPPAYASATPTWIAAYGSGTSSGVVGWGDVANESGYIIERSTNNANSFAEVARVGANVTQHNATGLSGGTTYYFRVRSYNGSGNSNPTASTSFTTSAAAVAPTPTTPTTPAPWIPPSNGTITNKWSLSGVSANTNGDPASMHKAALDDVGIKNVRIWYSIQSWHEQPNAWYINRAMDYKRAGYNVMLAVLSVNPTDANTAKTFFQRLSAYPGLKQTVDYWQIGNEPNMYEFWHGNAQQYVQNFLKPAYEALKPQGETVVGAGPSLDVNYAKQLTSYGYTNYIDYAGFHPYGDNAAQVIERAAGAKAAFNNKPLMVTEWNITGMAHNTSGWVSEMNKAAVGLSNIAYLSYYFALKNSPTHVGTGGLLNYSNQRNGPFYDAVKGWLR